MSSIFSFQSSIGKLLGCFGRFLWLDAPLLMALLLLTTTSLLQFTLHEFWLPLMNNVNWLNPQDSSYYGRLCTLRDISTQNTRDLIANTPSEAVAKAVRHGSTVIPHLLDPDLAYEFRNYFIQNIKERNGVFEGIIEPEHRATWGLDVWDDPIIPRVLQQVLPKMNHILTPLLGDDPAVVEFNHITTSYGAVEQHWHSDTGREVQASAYVRNYAQSYSLFITLQNTTAAMGATSVCPGTHMCWSGQNLACQHGGFQLFQEEPQGWPVGWGFLYNNAMQHRGSAHTDPDGPDRALFIMTFTARPRYGRRQLETRFLADHFFSQWWQTGFTLNDYINPHISMRQPWRALRNLGLIKFPSQHWGWDLPTLTIGFAENADHDESTGNGELITFLKKYAWLKKLPKALQGDFEESPEDSDQGDTGHLQGKRNEWVKFFTSLFSKWVAMAKRIYLGAVVMYMGCLVVMPRSRRRAMGHLVLWHVLIFGVGLLVVQRLEKSGWGVNIRRGVIHRVPNPRGIDAPSTLPFELDVLVPGDEFLSSYIGGYEMILDSVHPGNRIWHAMVSQYSLGFERLPPSAQHKLCQTLVKWVREKTGGRILMKNSLGDWANPGDADSLRFARKQLITASHPFVEYMVKGIDYLLSEARYGYWRMASMSHRDIPRHLSALQDRMIQHHPTTRNLFYLLNQAYGDRILKPMFEMSSQLCALPPKKRVSFLNTRRSLPPQRPLTGPFPGAWLQVGDTVEVNYQESDEWHVGTIVKANIDTGTWNVYFEDDNTVEEGLCRQCVRPYTPLKVGETVHWSIGDETLECTVVQADPKKEMYAVRRNDGAQSLVHLHRWALHRHEPRDYALEVGSYVEAPFDGDLSLSMVLEIYDDDTVLVVAEDGDEEEVDVGDIVFNPVWLGYALRLEDESSSGM